jgi:hypothetical protein
LNRLHAHRRRGSIEASKEVSEKNWFNFLSRSEQRLNEEQVAAIVFQNLQCSNDQFCETNRPIWSKNSPKWGLTM